jgi:hypothetical protein
MPLAAPDPAIEKQEYASRLNYLYRVVEDTQGTIRFLDTKAAFCVTLLSAMVAGVLQHPPHGGTIHRLLSHLFIAMVTLSLLVCLRVIFPTIKTTEGRAQTAGPKFFVGHNKTHHWILHTLGNRVDGALSESRESYVDAFNRATDANLLSSMCDEALILALIRQVKNDRLHVAMFCLAATVVPFTVLMME